MYQLGSSIFMFHHATKPSFYEPQPLFTSINFCHDVLKCDEVFSLVVFVPNSLPSRILFFGHYSQSSCARPGFSFSKPPLASSDLDFGWYSGTTLPSKTKLSFTASLQQDLGRS